MPKAVVGTNARKNLLKQDFEKAVKKKMAGDYTQGELGREYGISQPAMSYKISHAQFDFFELRKLFKILEFSGEEIIKIMKGV